MADVVAELLCSVLFHNNDNDVASMEHEQQQQRGTAQRSRHRSEQAHAGHQSECTQFHFRVPVYLEQADAGANIEEKENV